MNWSKLFPVVVSVLVPVIGANSDVIQQAISAHPGLAVVLAGLGAVLGSLAPSPIGGLKKE